MLKYLKTFWRRNFATPVIGEIWESEGNLKRRENPFEPETQFWIQILEVRQGWVKISTFLGETFETCHKTKGLGDSMPLSVLRTCYVPTDLTLPGEPVTAAPEPVTVALPREPVAGEIWELQSDDPFPRFPPHLCRILGVKDGWVRYSFVDSSMFLDNRKEMEMFLYCYKPYGGTLQ